MSDWKGNGGLNGEEREDRFRAKHGNKAKLEQDGDEPSAAKAKELCEAIVLQPGSAEALQRRLCSQKSWECCPFPSLCEGSCRWGLQWLTSPSSLKWAVPVLPGCVNGLSKKHTAQLLLEGIWKNNIRIPSPVHIELLCWPVSWSHTEGHAALLSVQELVFQALDGFGKVLRVPMVFPCSPSCCCHTYSCSGRAGVVFPLSSTSSKATPI